VDFTLAEVKTLQAFGRARHEDRKRRPGYQIPTLEETILLNQHLNTTTKRDCGLLVETKNPGFYRKEGRPLEAPLLEMLSRYGYTEPGKGIILQSFDAAHLRRLRLEYKTRLPLMLLVDTLPTAENLPEIAAWANGINPSRYAVEKDSTLTTQATVFLRLAKEKNLRVFVWTFNAEETHMRRFLSEFRVDGVITNNPDTGKRATEEADRK
jgi:glycerophosphoryl diester phosphodiesterase